MGRSCSWYLYTRARTFVNRDDGHKVQFVTQAECSVFCGTRLQFVCAFFVNWPLIYILSTETYYINQIPYKCSVGWQLKIYSIQYEIGKTRSRAIIKNLTRETLIFVPYRWLDQVCTSNLKDTSWAVAHIVLQVRNHAHTFSRYQRLH